MKTTLLLSTFLFHSFSIAFCQCLGPSQKIASPICTKPTNAKVNSLSCTELQVQWQGSSNQTYEVNATIKNPAAGETETFTTTETTCDAAGNCIGTIPVTAATKVTWSVQAICANGGRTFYSYALRGGKEVSIPNCELNPESNSITNVFPNPTTGNISVEYLSSSTGNVQFIVYDLMGRVVFARSEKTIQGMSSTFNFNLPDLPSGIYMLEARNGNDVSQRKFVIEK